MNDDAMSGALRDPAAVVSLSADASWWSPDVLEHRERGPFWDTLGGLGVTLLVTREYEHTVLALGMRASGPTVSVLRVPHPSGLVVDRGAGRVHVACTRNPNQVMTLAVAEGWLDRSDRGPVDDAPGLVPVATRFHPGSLYLHDLAIVDGRLVGTAVGINAVVDLDASPAEPVWWPASVDAEDGPRRDRNLIQLNSIAAGRSLDRSFFTASTAAPGPTRPGDPDWEIDRAGVVFAGAHRMPMVGGLTRPHSARLIGGGLWVDDSGYGRVCAVEHGELREVVALGGWTRGLVEVGGLAVVGTSRVIRRFAQYAPGVDVDTACCAIHLVEIASGRRVASLEWPQGDQIFAVDWIDGEVCEGFLGGDPAAGREAIDDAWYRYAPPGALPTDPTAAPEGE